MDFDPGRSTTASGKVGKVIPAGTTAHRGGAPAGSPRSVDLSATIVTRLSAKVKEVAAHGYGRVGQFAKIGGSGEPSTGNGAPTSMAKRTRAPLQVAVKQTFRH
jgi:hypothetical protein